MASLLKNMCFEKSGAFPLVNSMKSQLFILNKRTGVPLSCTMRPFDNINDRIAAQIPTVSVPIKQIVS